IASGAIIEGTNILAYLTEILTGVAMILVGVVVSFILIKIALAILSKIFNAITRNRSINGLDKLLGLVFGALKAALILAIACVGVYFVNMTSLATVVNNEIDKNPVANYIYDTADNYIEQLVTLALDKIDFNEVIADLFGIDSNTPTP
ncbi:MAG: CvpA family protein, partial [Clostridia bacterium]